MKEKDNGKKTILFGRHLLKSRKINGITQSKLDLTVRNVQNNRIMVSSKKEFCYCAFSEYIENRAERGGSHLLKGQISENGFENLLAADITEGIVTFLDSDILITIARLD